MKYTLQIHVFTLLKKGGQLTILLDSFGIAHMEAQLHYSDF